MMVDPMPNAFPEVKASAFSVEQRWAKAWELSLVSWGCQHHLWQ